MNTRLSTAREFWTAPVRAERLAAFRIAIGTLVAIDTALTILPSAALYLGADGLNPADLYRATHRGWSWSVIAPDATDAQIHVVVLMLIGAAACVALGFFTRIASILMWVLLVSVQRRSPYVLNGGDLLLQVGALYVMLMPAGTRWSLDDRLLRLAGIERSPWVSPWAFRLAQIQLCVTYLFTGLSKLPSPDGPGLGQWLSGTAVASSLGSATKGRFEFLTWFPWWVYTPVTYATLAFELSFPLLVAFARTRYAALVFGVLLHLGIFATLEVGSFSFATLCYYVLFLPPAWFGPEPAPRTQEGDDHA